MKTGKIMTLDDFMQSRLGKWADVYLVNGVRLSGKIVSFDQEALFLRSAGDVVHPLQMILWTAISTVSTSDESEPE